jgi:antirestriction protein ArdC
MKTDLYNKVTDQIVASLEQGVPPGLVHRDGKGDR